MHVHGALRPSGRARGVDDHEGILGTRILPVDQWRSAAAHHLAPRHVTLAPRIGAAQPLRDDDRPHARDAVGGQVGGLLHRHHRAPAMEAVGADEHGRIAVAQPAGDRLRAVAGEDRGVDRAERPEREHGDDALDAHRKEHRDPVSRSDADRAQPGREPSHIRPQLAVRAPVHPPVLALGDEREAPLVAVGTERRRSSSGRRSTTWTMAGPSSRPSPASTARSRPTRGPDRPRARSAPGRRSPR